MYEFKWWVAVGWRCGGGEGRGSGGFVAIGKSGGGFVFECDWEVAVEF